MGIRIRIRRIKPVDPKSLRPEKEEVLIATFFISGRILRIRNKSCGKGHFLGE
jgi:hypothetical protein